MADSKNLSFNEVIDAIRKEGEQDRHEMKKEGQLTRNTGTNSIKSEKKILSEGFDRFNVVFESISSVLGKQVDALQEANDLEKERIADEKRNQRLPQDNNDDQPTKPLFKWLEGTFLLKLKDGLLSGFTKIKEGLTGGVGFLGNIVKAGIIGVVGAKFLQGIFDEMTGGNFTKNLKSLSVSLGNTVELISDVWDGFSETFPWLSGKLKEFGLEIGIATAALVLMSGPVGLLTRGVKGLAKIMGVGGLLRKAVAGLSRGFVGTGGKGGLVKVLSSVGKTFTSVIGTMGAAAAQAGSALTSVVTSGALATTLAATAPIAATAGTVALLGAATSEYKQLLQENPELEGMRNGAGPGLVLGKYLVEHNLVDQAIAHSKNEGMYKMPVQMSTTQEQPSLTLPVQPPAASVLPRNTDVDNEALRQFLESTPQAQPAAETPAPVIIERDPSEIIKSLMDFTTIPAKPTDPGFAPQPLNLNTSNKPAFDLQSEAILPARNEQFVQRMSQTQESEKTGADIQQYIDNRNMSTNVNAPQAPARGNGGMAVGMASAGNIWGTQHSTN